MLNGRGYKAGRKLTAIVSLAAVVLCSLFGLAAKWDDKPVEVLYSTDLWVEGDQDDRYDLAVMYSMDSIDLHLLLDNALEGDLQDSDLSGKRAVENLNGLFGKEIVPMIWKQYPYGSGEKEPVTDEIIRRLQAMDGKCTIITVGSLRDIAAVYEQAPELLQEKVEKVCVFAGSYEQTYDEYNVEMDGGGYNAVMQSDLPIYWIPCFQNTLWSQGDHCSYFQIRQKDVMADCDEELLKWFIYEWQHASGDIDGFTVTDDVKKLFMEDLRNLWCSPLLPFLTGEYTEEDMLQEYQRDTGRQIAFPWHFEDDVFNGNAVKVFTIEDRENYVEFSKWLLTNIYRDKKT